MLLLQQLCLHLVDRAAYFHQVLQLGDGDASLTKLSEFLSQHLILAAPVISTGCLLLPEELH